MKKLALALSLVAVSASAFAGPRPGWDSWASNAGHGVSKNRHGSTATVATVPAGSATYTGSTVAVVSDSTSGTLARSVSTGSVSMDVTFSGTGTTTQAGTITGLTGAGGAAIGDLAFTGTGTGSKFSGTVTSSTYAAVAATSTSAATGTGKINGSLSAPVVDSATSAVSAPLSAQGHWNFAATSTLNARGSFAAVK